MNLGKLVKATLALTAAGLTLGATSGCQEKKPEAAPAAAAQPAARHHAASGPQMTASTPANETVATSVVATSDAGAGRLIEMTVTEDGYVPKEVRVRKGEPLLIRITRKTDQTCALDLIIADSNVKVPLPLNEAVEVPFTPAKSGQIKFGCAMDMMISGVLLVDEA